MPSTTIAPGTPLPDADTNQVMRLIPHRFPMLLIDRVVEMRAMEHAVGLKGVTINEPFFCGHFPGDPIMPGVLLIEAMAQTAAVLVVASHGPEYAGAPVYFMAIDRARFRRPVRPGDFLRLQVEVLRVRLGMYKFSGRAMIGEEVATEAEFGARLMPGARG